MTRRTLSDTRVLVLLDREHFVDGERLAPQTMENSALYALRALGATALLHFYEEPARLARAVQTFRPDVVFNLTEHAHGRRENDAAVAGLLDLLAVRYTGTAQRGLMLCRDKAFSKLVAATAGFHIPRFTLHTRATHRIPALTGALVVVKPRFADSSEGITAASLVRDANQYLQCARRLFQDGFTHLICEEYIHGREIYATVLGGTLISPRELVVPNVPIGEPFLADHRLKHDERYRATIGARVIRARLTRSELSDLRRLTLAALDALDVRDYGRLDLRLTDSGRWVFLEANPNPGLSPGRKSQLRAWQDISYHRVIDSIIRQALQRPGGGAVGPRVDSGVNPGQCPAH